MNSSISCSSHNSFVGITKREPKPTEQRALHHLPILSVPPPAPLHHHIIWRKGTTPSILSDPILIIIIMSGVELLPFVWALPLTYFAASYGSSSGKTLSSSSSSSPDDHPARCSRKHHKQRKRGLNRVCEGRPGQWKLDEAEEEEESTSCIPSANHHRGQRKPYLLDDVSNEEEQEEQDAGLMKLLLTGSDYLRFLSYILPEKTHVIN